MLEEVRSPQSHVLSAHRNIRFGADFKRRRRGRQRGRTGPFSSAGRRSRATLRSLAAARTRPLRDDLTRSRQGQRGRCRIRCRERRRSRRRNGGLQSVRAVVRALPRMRAAVPHPSHRASESELPHAHGSSRFGGAGPGMGISGRGRPGATFCCCHVSCCSPVEGGLRRYRHT